MGIDGFSWDVWTGKRRWRRLYVDYHSSFRSQSRLHQNIFTFEEDGIPFLRPRTQIFNQYLELLVRSIRIEYKSDAKTKQTGHLLFYGN